MTKDETELIKTRAWPCIVSVALASVCSAGAWAQTQLATVSAAITDPSGAAVPGVAVSIVNHGTGLKGSAFTDTVSPACQQESVRINSQLAIGDLSQETMVKATATAIDNTTSTASGLLPEQSLTELPLNNRDLFSADTQEPGVAPNPSSPPSLLSNGKSTQV